MTVKYNEEMKQMSSFLQIRIWANVTPDINHHYTTSSSKTSLNKKLIYEIKKEHP